MTNSSREGDPNSQLPVFFGWDPKFVMQTFAPLMGTASEQNGSALTSWLEMNQQWTSFLIHRFQNDLELIQKLSACKDPASVGDTYTAFFKAAQADYQNKFLEMTRLNSKKINASPADSQNRRQVI